MKPYRHVDNISLSDNYSLQGLLDQLKDKGVTDLTQVKIKMDYQSCCGGHGDGEYCYCPTTYSDIRLEWEIPKP